MLPQLHGPPLNDLQVLRFPLLNFSRADVTCTEGADSFKLNSLSDLEGARELMIRQAWLRDGPSDFIQGVAIKD